MKLLQVLLIDEFVRALGWTLLHSLWQILAIAALSALILARLQRSAASVRYIVACFAIGAMFFVVPCTLAYVLTKGTPTSTLLPVDASFSFTTESPWADAPVTKIQAGQSDRAEDWPRNWYGIVVESLDFAAPYLAFVWLLGFTLFTLRTGAGCLSANRLIQLDVESLPDRIHSAVKRLAERIGITRPLRALASRRVDVPCIVGWLRPVLLVPISVLSEMPMHQLEALLAHELAHVRRHDYLVNFLQRLLESALFYHPAVWWLSRRIREERENCCDDIAVAFCGDAADYATALAKLEESRVTTPRLVMAASGGSLLSRIHRLIVPTVIQPMSRVPAILSAFVLVGLFMAVGTKWVNAQRPSEISFDARTRVLVFVDSDDAPSMQPTTPAQRAVAQRLSEPISLGDLDTSLREVVTRLTRATELRIVCPLELGLLNVHGQFGSKSLADELASMLAAAQLGCRVETNGVLRIVSSSQLASRSPSMLQFAARLDAEALRRHLFDGEAFSVSELVEQLDERIPAVITRSDREELATVLRRIDETLPQDMVVGTIRVQAERASVNDSGVRFAVELSGMCRMPGASAANRVERIAAFKRGIEETPAIIGAFDPSIQISTRDGADFVNPQTNMTAFSLVLAPRAFN